MNPRTDGGLGRMRTVREREGEGVIPAPSCDLKKTMLVSDKLQTALVRDRTDSYRDIFLVFLSSGQYPRHHRSSQEKYLNCCDKSRTFGVFDLYRKNMVASEKL